jgi:hypothetical protein
MSGYGTYMQELDGEIESVQLKLKVLSDRLKSEVNEDLCVFLCHEIKRLQQMEQYLLTEQATVEAWATGDNKEIYRQ